MLRLLVTFHTDKQLVASMKCVAEKERFSMLLISAV